MTGRGSHLRSVATVLMDHVLKAMPKDRTTWAQAMANEVHVIEKGSDAFRWALGCVMTCYLEKLEHSLGELMSRHKIHLLGTITPFIMSTLAFLIVLAVVTTGWERNLKDEGVAAHLFQILIVAQLPFIIAFLVTANWERRVAAARPLLFQFLAISVAIGSVAIFKL